MRFEVQGCGKSCPSPCLECVWDACELVVVRRHGLVDVRIDDDSQLCERVPRRFLRPLQPPEAPTAQPAAKEAPSAEEASTAEPPHTKEAPVAAPPQAKEAPAAQQQPLLLGFGAALTGGKAHASAAKRTY